MPKLTSVITRTFPIPGDPDKAELKIKHLKPGEIQKIESEFTDWVGKANGEDSFTTELKFNPTLQQRAVRAASVVGWRGFRGFDDEVIECNRKNINLYLDEDPVLGDGDKTFSMWIDTFRKALTDEIVGEDEAAKN